MTTKPTEWALREAEKLLAYGRDKYHNALIIDAARRKGIEEAASHFARGFIGPYHEARRIIDSIRALTDKEPT